MLQDNNGVCPDRACHTTICSDFCIGADHPSLPGHFPGRPIVPGALLLQRVIERLELHFVGHCVGAIRRARFSGPVMPDDIIELHAELSSSDIVRFRCMHRGSGQLCIEGRVQLLPPIAEIAR